LIGVYMMVLIAEYEWIIQSAWLNFITVVLKYYVLVL
jgi:hypothetical protein